MNWEKSDKESRQANAAPHLQSPVTDNDRKCFEVRGAAKMAGDCYVDGAVKLDAHYHYNGSGRSAFGGAKQWPNLSVEVSFKVGQEAQRDALLAKIQALIETELTAIGNV
jgi:hypothetical protein